MDDLTGSLPPHELRAIAGNVVDHSDPHVGPSVVGGSTPGLSTGAASPAAVTAPVLGPDDPAALAVALSRMLGDMGVPSSVVAVPSPERIISGSGAASPFSPGISPQLGAAPSPSLPTDVAAPQLVPVTTTAAKPPNAPASVGHPGTPAPAGFPGRFGSPAMSPASLGHVPSSPPSLPQSIGPTTTPPSTPSMPQAFGAPPVTSPLPVSSPFGAPPSVPTNFGGIPGLDLGRIPLLDERASDDDGSPHIAGLTASHDPGGPIAHDPRSPVGHPGVGFDRPSAGPFELPAFDRISLLDSTSPSDSIASVPDAHRLPLVDAAPPIRQGGGTAFDPHLVRKDFPILNERVHNKRLVWLDNGATTQKPRAVIDRLTHFYEHENSNVHRAAHTLAARSTDAFESARESTRKFINAPSKDEVVFVRGTTEGINLIAKAWGKRYIERGDEIVLTHLEHHANIVPWQMLCQETGARLRIAPVDDRGDVILEQFERLMCSRTKLVAFTQVSNALGTVTPAKEMIEIAHRWGATTLLDGAQAVSHMPVDVQDLGCDFYVFSGHKVFAPTGIGAVWGRKAILDEMPPWQGGGNMIADVTFEKTVYQPPPWRFEAGTGNIADAAGMGAALEYVMRIGMPTIERYEHDLLHYALERLPTVPGLSMVGNPRNRAGVLSFVLNGQRTEDVGAALDKEGIAVRSGHHCAQPILRRFGLEASVRASLAFYNVHEDIDALIDALKRLQKASA